MTYLKKISRALNNLTAFVGGLTLVVMMLLACSNMVLRAFGHPIKGSFELMGFFGALLAAFALGHTQEKKGQMALTLLAGKFPRKMEKVVDALGHLVTAVFFALITWRVITYAMFLIKRGELSESLRIIYYPFVLAVALGCAVLALALAVDFLSVVFNSREKSA